MTAPAARAVKPHKVRGRELEEVREKSIRTGGSSSITGLVDTLGSMLSVGHDRPGYARCRDGTSRRPSSSRKLDPLRALPILRVPGTGREPELNERQLDARRRVHRGVGGAGRPLEPGRQLRLACRRFAAECAGVGDPTRLERAAGAPRAGAGDSGSRSRYAERPTRAQQSPGGIDRNMLRSHALRARRCT